MKRGIYSPNGPWVHLQNKGTLLRQDPDNPDNYLAQFNPRHLREAFGWHSFPKRDFINVEDIGVSNE